MTHVIFDFEFGENGVILGRHFVDIDDPVVRALLTRLNDGTQPIAGTGWEEITDHPSYPGETRLHAVMEEIKKAGLKL